MLFVKFIAGFVMNRRLTARSAAHPAAILALRHERHALGHDFVLAALLTVFGFPAALLEPSFNDRPVALAQILAAMFRLLAEHHDIDKTHFLF